MDDPVASPVLFWPSILAALIGAALIWWEARQIWRARQLRRGRWTTEE